MRSILAVPVFGAVLFAASCGESKPAASSVANIPSAPEAPTPTPRNIAAESDDKGTLATGPIIVEHEIDMTAQRDGILAKIFFDAPARVKAGTLLAQFDDRQTVANLEAAKAKTRGMSAELKNWQAETEVFKADYVRAQRLFDLGLSTEEQLQHAKFKAESDQWDVMRVTELLNTAKQEERSLELEMEKTKVLAPFDGLIARRYVREGQNVTKGDRLFWITAESPLLMRFTLPERLFGKLHGTQELEVSPANTLNEKHIARVKQISPVIDPSSGTFEVLVQLAGDRGTLCPGMTATVRLPTAK